MISRIHVDQHVIRANVKNDRTDPPITIQRSTGPEKASKVEILDDDGNVVATIIYRPEKPLSCGARLWIETRSELRVA